MSSTIKILKSKPLVIASCACSLDGYLDDSSSERLIFSSEEDYRQVRKLRATCDAILVGAETIRRDNPRLTVRMPELEKQRLLRGTKTNPTKVTMTSSGNLAITSKFFNEEPENILVFCDAGVPPENLERLSTVSTVVRLERLSATILLNELWDRGVSSVLVEGGSRTLEQFFKEGQVHRLRLARAPFKLAQNGSAGLFNQGSAPTLPAAFAQESFGPTAVTWHQMQPKDLQSQELRSILRKFPDLFILELKSGHTFTFEPPIENLKLLTTKLGIQGYDTNHALVACSKLSAGIPTLNDCKVRHIVLMEPPSGQQCESLQTAGIQVSLIS